jgi:hypothetical protein
MLRSSRYRQVADGRRGDQERAPAEGLACARDGAVQLSLRLVVGKACLFLDYDGLVFNRVDWLVAVVLSSTWRCSA